MPIKHSLIAQFGALEARLWRDGLPIEQMNEILLAGRKGHSELVKSLEVLNKSTGAERFQFLLLVPGQASLPAPGTEQITTLVQFRNEPKVLEAHTGSRRIIVFRCDNPEWLEN
jgi:hypothetical protein